MKQLDTAVTIRQQFIEACKTDNLDNIKYLLHHPDICLLGDETSLCIANALGYGNLEVMKFLCSNEMKNPIDIQQQRSEFIYFAIRSEKLNILKYLTQELEGDPDLTYIAWTGNSLFDEVCGFGNIDIINFFLYDLNYPVSEQEKINTLKFRCDYNISFLQMVENRDSFMKLLDLDEKIYIRAKMKL